MRSLHTLLSHYHLTQTELGVLVGRHRSSVCRLANGQRTAAPEAITRLVHLASCACSPGHRPPQPLVPIYGEYAERWLEEEQLKADIQQQKLIRLLRRLEQQQRQVFFWYQVCHYTGVLSCSKDWLERHYTEKLYRLQHCWEREYLPQLMRLRQTEMRIRMLELLQNPTEAKELAAPLLLPPKEPSLTP